MNSPTYVSFMAMRDWAKAMPSTSRRPAPRGAPLRGGAGSRPSRKTRPAMSAPAMTPGKRQAKALLPLSTTASDPSAAMVTSSSRSSLGRSGWASRAQATGVAGRRAAGVTRSARGGGREEVHLHERRGIEKVEALGSGHGSQLPGLQSGPGQLAGVDRRLHLAAYVFGHGRGDDDVTSAVGEQRPDPLGVVTQDRGEAGRHRARVRHLSRVDDQSLTALEAGDVGRTGQRGSGQPRGLREGGGRHAVPPGRPPRGGPRAPEPGGGGGEPAHAARAGDVQAVPGTSRREPAALP